MGVIGRARTGMTFGVQPQNITNLFAHITPTLRTGRSTQKLCQIDS